MHCKYTILKQDIYLYQFQISFTHINTSNNHWKYIYVKFTKPKEVNPDKFRDLYYSFVEVIHVN